MKLKRSTIILLLLILILLFIIVYLSSTEKNTSIGKDLKCDLTYRIAALG